LKARQRIEDPCIGGSIPPRATKNIVHATPTITGWRFCLWIDNPCTKLAGETSARHAIFSSIYLSIRLLRLLRPVLPALCANLLCRTLLLAQFSARQTKLSPDTVSDELCSYVAWPRTADCERTCRSAHQCHSRDVAREAILNDLRARSLSFKDADVTM